MVLFTGPSVADFVDTPHPVCIAREEAFADPQKTKMTKDAVRKPQQELARCKGTNAVGGKKLCQRQQQEEVMPSVASPPRRVKSSEKRKAE